MAAAPDIDTEPGFRNLDLRYRGFDISQVAVEAARTLGLNVELLTPDGRTTLADDCCDLAICFEVFEHLLEPQLARPGDSSGTETGRNSTGKRAQRRVLALQTRVSAHGFFQSSRWPTYLKKDAME